MDWAGRTRQKARAGRRGRTGTQAGGSGSRCKPEAATEGGPGEQIGDASRRFRDARQHRKSWPFDDTARFFKMSAGGPHGPPAFSF